MVARVWGVGRMEEYSSIGANFELHDKTFSYRWELIYSMVTIANNNVYLKFAEKELYLKKRYMYYLCVKWWVG
jgi:hypothetical protein